MEIRKLKKESINNIIDNSETYIHVLVGLYKHVFPDFDKAEKIGFPIVTNETASYILERTHEKFPNNTVDINFLWLNKGFSCCETETPIDDFEVFIPDNIVTYKKEEA